MQYLSKDDSNVLKGISIIFIVLHNYCHMLPDSLDLDNEYYFNIENTIHFWNNLINFNHIFDNIMSYAGYVFICAFLFVSGYGLSRKYPDRFALKDLLSSYFKLFKLVFLAVPFSVLSKYVFMSDTFSFKEVCLQSIAQLTFITNLIPGMHLLEGPYWYLSLTMQMYVLYYLFKRFKSFLFPIILTLFCLIIQIIALYVGKYEIVYLKYNFMGWILPFIYGMYVAKNGLHSLKWFMNAIIVSLTILSCINKYVWVGAPLFITILITQLPMKVLKNKFLIYIGSLSSCIFIIHPIIRTIILFKLNHNVEIYIYVILTLIFSIAYKKLNMLIWSRLKLLAS